jgi:uncharacterized repeat protein (TIGR01451 family)
VTWTVTNTGNTAAAYSTELFRTTASSLAGFKFQLIVHKTYETPVAIGCELKTQRHTEVLVNLNYQENEQPSQFAISNALDPADATFVVSPGEQVKITVRIVDPDRADGTNIDVAHDIVAAVRSEAVNTEQAETGVTTPPIVTPPSVRTLMFVTQPSTVTAGVPIAPAVNVQLLGLGGIAVPSQVVTMVLGVNPWGASVAGDTVAVTDENGIATFTNLRVTLAGGGYRLLASTGDGAPSPLSQSFSVLQPPAPLVNLAIGKSLEPAAPVVGGTVTYSLIVANSTPQPATNATVSDSLPGGVSFASALSSQGACTHANGVVVCQLGTVTSGTPVTVSIAVTALVSGLITNQAVVSSAEGDMNPADNSASASVTVASGPDGLVGIYTVHYLGNGAGCSPVAPNPFECTYMSGPIAVDTATTPAGTYRLEILQPLDPDQVVGGFAVWDGTAVSGTKYVAGDSFHHTAGNIYLYAHDWYPWDNPPGSGWIVGVYRESIEDTFESAVLDSAWTVVSSQFGSVSPSTAQNVTPGGLQSLAFSSSQGGQRSMMLERSLGGLTQGAVKVSFYDTAPNLETLYTDFYLVDSSSGLAATIGTQDFDAYCYKAFVGDPVTNTNYGPNANCGIFPRSSTTNVARTAGWHVFEIRWDSQMVTFFIDGQQIFQRQGTYNFDRVRIDMSGPVWRPDATYYFDDFSIRQ